MSEEKKHIQAQVKRMHDEIKHASEEKKNLKQNELFVLDNSLRESTVGQLRGHTIENKWKIYEQVGVYYFKFWPKFEAYCFVLARSQLIVMKPKIAVIIPANHKGHKDYSEPIKTRGNYIYLTASAGIREWVTTGLARVF